MTDAADSPPPAGAEKRRGTFIAEVLDNVRLCEDHYRLTLGLERFPRSRPGQFVQLQCRYLTDQPGAREADWPEGQPPRLNQAELTDCEPLLRRPLSIAGRTDSAVDVELELIYRTIGTGTHWLAAVRPGRRLSVLGPLGNGFDIPEDKTIGALVGGGVGIPPMIYLSHAMHARGMDVVSFSGAARRALLPLTLLPDATPSVDGDPDECIAEFAPPIRSVAATDDGSLGFHGYVSAAFERWLDAEAVDPETLVACACGPEPMMQAVGRTCAERGILCLLALERHMACGMGTCQSCIVRIADESERGWSYKLCCTDGPVFDARTVLW